MRRKKYFTWIMTNFVVCDKMNKSTHTGKTTSKTQIDFFSNDFYVFVICSYIDGYRYVLCFASNIWYRNLYE